jgi:hypothetical protein
MQNKRWIQQLYSSSLLLAVLLFIGCTTASKSNSAVFNYADFGPQVASYEVIGFEWYQWDHHGSSNPHERYNIKIVVYRDISLKQIQQKYPVVVGKQDYRYLEYSMAIKHLETLEKEPILAEHAAATKAKILTSLGY